MKPVPLVLLLASVLLTSHIRPGACRPPRNPPALLYGNGGFRSQQPDEVFLRAAAARDHAASHLPGGEKILKFLQRHPNDLMTMMNLMMTALPEFPLVDVDDEGRVKSRGAHHHLSRSSTSWETEESAAAREEGGHRGVVELAAGLLLSKRNDEPPISIDLTFHLLRNMLEIAKIESQRERAELNRKFLDEVGK